MKDTKLLVVVDAQYDFVDGKLGSKKAQEAIPRIHDFIENWPSNDDIAYTADTHYSDTYMNTQEGRKLPVPHCLYNSHGAKIVQEVLPSDLDRHYIVLKKDTFGYKHWLALGLGSYSEIHLVGFCTDICVITNALLIKTLCPETPIIVHSSMCAGVTPELHEKALDVMRSCQIEVVE